MTFDFHFYWTLFLRRLPAMAALFLLCAGIGGALAFKLPTTYSTTARMLVEAPQIADLPGTAQTAGAEQLEIIQQRLMTRANLIEIANGRKVFGDTTGRSPDDIVEAMRDATDINRSSGRDRATLMTISFSAGSPQIVAEVVGDYVTLILDENARQRTGAAESTLSFFEQQVERLNTELNIQSERIVTFKNANTSALPDTLEYRLDRESLVQERLAQTERDISSLSEQRKRIVDIFEATGRIQAPQQQQLSPAEQRLAQLRAELESQRLVYSDTHPKVRILLGQIAQQETAVAAQGGAAPEAENTQEAMFNIALAQIDSQMDALEQRHQSNTAELEKLRTSIELTAANGIALADLERDYANAQSQYNAAIASRDQARIAEQIELSNRGQRITVLEQPSIPNQPSSPNRLMIGAGGIATGIAAMAALFMLLEMLNRTIRRPVEMKASLGVTPLATIPYMETRRHFWMRRSLKLALLAVVVISVPLALWAVDTYYSPLDLIYAKLLVQLGL